MVPPPDDVTPDDEDGDVDGGSRWSWLFWWAFVAAAAPAAVSLLLTLSVYQDDDLVHQYTSTPDPAEPLAFGDRWAVVLRLDQSGWTSTLTALATLVLAAVVVSGRPPWLRAPSARTAVLVLAVGGSVWALGSALATCAYLLSDLTPAEEAARREWGDQRTRFAEWAATGGQLVLAAGVGAVSAWWCGRRSHERVGEDPFERAPAE